MEACEDFVFSIKFLVVIYENIDMNIQYFNLTELVGHYLQYSDLFHIRFEANVFKTYYPDTFYMFARHRCASYISS